MHDPLGNKAMQSKAALINLVVRSHGMFPVSAITNNATSFLVGYCSKNKRHPQVPFHFVPCRDQAAASALICADRRLLVREALFLWTIFLSAMRSRTATDCW